MNELRRIDLNLLLTLHALLTEQHVTRAAIRVHKSQPAVSHAFAQLRTIFKDPLLTRQGGGMVLTPKAQELVQPLKQALSQLEGLLTSPVFDPSKAERRFRLALSDYATHLLLPKLVRYLRTHAPGIDLAISQSSRETMLAQLLDGEIDLELGVFPETSQDIQLQTLFKEYFISIADSTILPAQGELSLEEWLAYPHVLVAVRPDTDNEIDTALALRGLQRHVAIVLPHWSISTKILLGTNLILTVASRTLIDMSDNAALQAFVPPLELPPFLFQQAWHARRNTDPAHSWLREAVLTCSQVEHD